MSASGTLCRWSTAHTAIFTRPSMGRWPTDIAFFYPQAAQEEKLIFLAGVFMFGGLVAFAIYRPFYLGLVWTEFDMENVIFHYSRKEEYWFRWEEIPENRVQVERAADMFFVSGRMGGREKSP